MPELHWSRQDGRQFPPNIKQLPGGVLRLSNVTAMDSGSYVCSAINSVGSVSAVAYIEVQSVPVIDHDFSQFGHSPSEIRGQSATGLQRNR